LSQNGGERCILILKMSFILLSSFEKLVYLFTNLNAKMAFSIKIPKCTPTYRVLLIKPRPLTELMGPKFSKNIFTHKD